MKALFTVKSIKSNWQPPFKKEVTEVEFNVIKDNEFDELKRKNGSIKVFKLINLKNEKALIEYNSQFTLKNGLNPKNRQIWIKKNETISFTYQWGNKGITKILELKNIE